MQRRHFIQGGLMIFAGTALGSLTRFVRDDVKRRALNRPDDAARNISSALEEMGLLAALEGLEARVLGGAVYSLACGIAPARIQIEVVQARFEEASLALENLRNVEIELWSDRFSCCRLGVRTPSLTLFSSLNYLARFKSGRPLGLFRHQGLSFDVRRRAMADAFGWLASDKPKLEVSPEVEEHLAGEEAKQNEVLLLAATEKAQFDIGFGAKLESLRKVVRIRQTTSLVGTQSSSPLPHCNQVVAGIPPAHNFFPRFA